MVDTSEQIIQRDDTVYVPEKKKGSLFKWIALIIAGLFIAIGISAFTSIIYGIQSAIQSFIMGWTGWDTMLSSIFITAIFLFFGVLIYIGIKRWGDIRNRIEKAFRLDITKEPTEFYAIDLIPNVELANEFKERGCVVSELDDGGLSIMCPDMEVDPRMEKVITDNPFTLTNLQKFLVVVVLVIIWCVYVGALWTGALIDDLIWIWALILLGISVIVLLGTNILSLWQTVAVGVAVVVFITFFIPLETYAIWTIWGVLAVYAVLVCIGYLYSSEACDEDDEDDWYCDLM